MMTAESLQRHSIFCYRVSINSVLFHILLSAHSFFSIPLSTPLISPCPHLSLSLHHPLLTPGPHWHLPGALTFSHGSPCCSPHVRAGGFMANIHQRHMPGFMGDGVQTWSLWISLAESDPWAVVGYNGWVSLLPTPSSTHTLTFHLSPPILHTPPFIPLPISPVLYFALVGSSWSFIYT